MQPLYYVFHFDEDGDVHLDVLDQEKLEDRLNGEYYGSEQIFTKLPDPEYDHGLLIIKGNIVVPKPKIKVTKWEVE